MTLSEEEINKQARLFTQYLIKQQPSKLELDLYSRAVANSKHKINSKDHRLFEFVNNHSWSIGLIDSAMALTNPNSEMRKRLLIMFSILECMPERYDQFIPQELSSWYWLTVIYSCLADGLKAVAGSVLLKVIN